MRDAVGGLFSREFSSVLTFRANGHSVSNGKVLREAVQKFCRWCANVQKCGVGVEAALGNWSLTRPGNQGANGPLSL